MDDVFLKSIAAIARRYFKEPKWRPDPYVDQVLSPSLDAVMKALAGECKWCEALQVPRNRQVRFVNLQEVFPTSARGIIAHCTGCHRDVHSVDEFIDDDELYNPRMSLHSKESAMSHPRYDHDTPTLDTVMAALAGCKCSTAFVHAYKRANLKVLETTYPAWFHCTICHQDLTDTEAFYHVCT